MPTQDNIQDVTVNSLSIRSAIATFDIEPFLVELNIEESLFKTSLTGSIVLADSYNIPEKFPIVGEETVNIDISLAGLDGRADETFYTIKPPPMHINSISGRFFSKPKAQVFTLELVSEQYMSNIHSKVSRSYNDYLISDMVTDIYYNYLGDEDKTRPFRVEPTNQTESLIIPNLSPLEAIKWLTKRAIQVDGNGVNYLFFETLSGPRFVSLNKLSENESFFRYRLSARLDDPTGVENLAVGIQRINKIYFMGQFDKVDNAINGLYSSKLVTHDIVRKKITQHDFNGYNNFVGLNHAGTFPTISSSNVETKSSEVPRTSFAPADDENAFPISTEKDLSSMTDSHVVFYPKHNQLYAKNKSDLYDNKVEEWKLQRTSQIKSYDNITFIIEVAGNSLIRVGQIITIDIPSPESTDADKSSGDYFDKFLSGNYMITAIKHVFHKVEAKDNKITYTMKIEVVKDALEDLVANRTSRKDI